MIRKLAPLSLLVLAACNGGLSIADFRPQPAATPAAIAPPTPQPQLLTAKERLVQAIENNGCTLDTSNVGAVLAEATISGAEFRTLGAELVAEGRAQAAGEGAIRVTTDVCT